MNLAKYEAFKTIEYALRNVHGSELSVIGLMWWGNVGYHGVSPIAPLYTYDATHDLVQTRYRFSRSPEEEILHPQSELWWDSNLSKHRESFVTVPPRSFTIPT